MADYVTAQQFDSFRLEEGRHHKENEKSIADIKTEIKSIHTTLFGNGVPGWDEMLRTLYADYLERKEAEKEAEKERRKNESKTDKEKKLQKIIGSWQFQIALLNGVLLAVIEIVKGLLN